MSWVSVQKGIDWFLKSTKQNQVLIILICIIGFSYYNSIDTAEKYKSTIEILEANQKILEAKNIELEKRLNKLTAEIIVFKASEDNLPIPQWIKSIDGKFIWVSIEFEKKYLTSQGLKAVDVIGRYESDFIAPEMAQKFIAQDLKVLRQKRPITFKDVFFLDRSITITKYPYKVGKEILGIAGVEYYEYTE